MQNPKTRRTPEEQLTGNTPDISDISEYLDFGFYDVAIHFCNTYQFHVDMLNLSMNNHNDQPDEDGDSRGAQNQCSNVVLEPVETIQPP